MKDLLRKYVDEFNRNDDELYVNEIPNAAAYEWLCDRIPLFECPDKELEKTYYFRWWTYRKHVKHTPEGYAISEFLPDVLWAGRYNIINAPAGHHFYEGRWLRKSDGIFSDYLRFYLNNSEDAHRYSSWLLYAAMQYELVSGELSVGEGELLKMIEYYEEWERGHRLPTGAFWSYDDRDAMEYSISGHRNGKMVKGIRPTLNSYMCAEATAIAYFADKIGVNNVKEEYLRKAEELRRIMNETLVFDGFYKARHGEHDDEILDVLKRSDDTGSPMELIGYVPFMFGLAPDGLERAFYHLDDSEVFLAKTGMATADMRHPDFLKEYNHECLWNGYVWPFATSQVLTGLIKTIHRGHPELKPIFIKHLDLYSKMHRIELDGTTLPWIDEVMSPHENVWTSRAILEGRGWQEGLGGKERGKDYNHSTFCDLVISGIVGVRTDSEQLTLDPAIPRDWEYMRLNNLEYRGKLYTVIYDKTGEKYGKGKGLRIIESEK